MFVGEMGCWLVVGAGALYRRLVSKTASPSSAGYEAVSTNDTDADAHPQAQHPDTDSDGPPAKSDTTFKGYRILLLALPAICDICGTTLMNAGLLMVAASIYQMTRGALVLFVGLFSVLFLGRRLFLFQWISLVGVMLGVGVVGLAGAIWPDDQKKAQAATEAGAEALLAVVGVLLIAGAQVFTATQFVLEEWLLERSTIEPIRVVGWEGIFGFAVTLLGMVILHLAIGRTEAGRYGYFDMVEGWRQVTSSKELWGSSILIMISIG